MKSYTITVNGTAYEVTVEENGNAAAPVAAAPKAAAPAPKAAPAAAPKAAAPAAGAGSVKVSAAVPGKVVKIVASVGQSVKAGDSVVIVESMKDGDPGCCSSGRNNRQHRYMQRVLPLKMEILLQQ